MKIITTVCAFAILGACAMPAAAAAASLSRSVDVKGEPRAVWAAIGPFCAISDWHPAIASCTQDGKTPPTRTLLTKDKATFVELQTSSDPKAHAYGYTFLSSPVPVTHYRSTFKVTAKGKGMSTVTWSGDYIPNNGQAQAANDALSGIYESGLAAIKAKLAN